jgi:glycosyltransferase involved in cell wall biosynthesis
MNIIAIISRDLEKGSTKYRLVQYMDFLSEKGIKVEFVNRKSIDSSILRRAHQVDVVFNQKCLFKTSMARKLIASSHRTIFDFDDAIYTRPNRPHTFITNFRVKRRLHLWLKNSHVVTTPNQVLAGYARQFTEAVKILPMALNLQIWRPRDTSERENMIVGWAGAPVNVPLIERLQKILTAILKKFPFVKLAVFSGKKPKLSCPFEYYPYKPGGEAAFVRNLDIGLLPLSTDEYAKGKSPIKALQYLACGIPVIGNVVGATGEILNDQNCIAVTTESEWFEALKKLISNRHLARSMGRNGHGLVKKHHNLKIVAENFYRILTAY